MAAGPAGDPRRSSRTIRSSATPALGVDCHRRRGAHRVALEVEVTRQPDGARTLATRSIVVATGARPLVPPIPGIERVGYLTSDTVWDCASCPRRLLVLGGGPIGCELAQAFARLGSRGDPGRDAAAASCRARTPRCRDIVARASRRRHRVCGRPPGRSASCARGGDECLVAEHGRRARCAIAFDALLLRVGRVANTEGFGLEALGIADPRTARSRPTRCCSTSYP